MKTVNEAAKKFASDRWVRGDHNGLRETARECESTFLAGAEWQRERDAEIAKSYAKTTECRWGQGAKFNAEKIATKILTQSKGHKTTEKGSDG